MTTKKIQLYDLNKENALYPKITVEQLDNTTISSATNGQVLKYNGTNWVNSAEQDISGKQDKSTAVTHTASTATGSATQPVYVNSSGVATATTYSLNKTVPSNAVFTDTVTTATTEGTGNAVTAISATDGALTVTKGTTFLTSHQDISGKADKATTLSGYGITDAYTKTEVDAKVSSVFKYKGSVATTSNLPTSGQTVGDVYNVQTADSSKTIVPEVVRAGDNVVWAGSNWDVLSGTIDISGKADKTYVDTELAKKQDTLTSTQLNATNSGITSAKVSNYDTHISDSDIHVTSTQKDTWDAKQDAITTDNKLSVSLVDGLATVATSGSYSDLSDKPTIPTVNNATLTIQKNGTTVNTFTANSSTNVTANITVPTKTSDLTNDSGYGTITGIKMNGSSKGTTGVVDLGTVITAHQDISGKADKATTLAGYGITDAKIASGVITLGSNSITPLTSHQDISGKADKATTLAGYGITDAKISSGTIILGSNSITPLTSHQSLANYSTLANTVKSLSISGKTITVTPGSGSTYTLTTQDTTYSAFGGATSSSAGSSGLVPAPAKGKQTSFLRGDGTWVVPTNTTYTSGTGLSLSGTTFNHSNSVTAATAGTSSATSGSTLDVPYVTYDAQGHITATGTHTHTVTGFLTAHQSVTNSAPTLSWGNTSTVGTIGSTSLTVTMPANPNTDKNVTQTVTTSNYNYPILFKNTNATTTVTDTARFASAITINPSTGNLAVTQINGVTVGSSPKFTDTVTTASTSGSGNAVTSVTASNGVLTVTKGTTFLTSHQDISGKADKATTLSGYGITDAKIADGVITLGSNTITPLTSHQSLASYAKLASPTFTGTPAAPTANVGTNTTQIATTAFVKAEINSVLEAADAMIFKGTLGTGGTVTALPTSGYKVGWTYRVITAGTYAGNVCEVGDMIVAIKDYASAFANSDWTVIQNNLDGAVIGPSSSVDGRIATYSGTTGKVIKDSGYTIATSVPANAKFTDTTYTGNNGITLSGTTFGLTSGIATAGTAGTSSATSGSTLDVPYVTVDTYGRVTGYGTHTHTISGFLTSSSTLDASKLNTNTVASLNATKINGVTVGSSPKFTDTVYTHPDSGVTAGTYRSVTVDAQGHVTAGTNPTTLAGYGITSSDSLLTAKQDTITSSNKLAASLVSGLATVATSGSYNDLSNKPTIPTVNNGTLTIQKNGTTVNTFTANSSTNVTANITVPTTLASLTGDVTISSATDGDTLCYSNGKWINKTPTPVTSLSQLTGDVAIDSSSLANQQILQYNSTTEKWENEPLDVAVLYETTGQNTDGAMTQKATTDALSNKQNTLTAGTGIDITNNVISNTQTYTASDGITLSGTNFTNSGVRSVTASSTDGCIDVNTNGTTTQVTVVAVYG